MFSFFSFFGRQKQKFENFFCKKMFVLAWHKKNSKNDVNWLRNSLLVFLGDAYGGKLDSTSTPKVNQGLFVCQEATGVWESELSKTVYNYLMNKQGGESKKAANQKREQTLVTNFFDQIYWICFQQMNTAGCGVKLYAYS